MILYNYYSVTNHPLNSLYKVIFSIKEKTLVLFYADWCPYCANFKPTFEEIKPDKIEKKAALVNEGENPLWDRFNIQSILTIIVFQNGKILTWRDAKRGKVLREKIWNPRLKNFRFLLHWK